MKLLTGIGIGIGIIAISCNILILILHKSTGQVIVNAILLPINIWNASRYWPRHDINQLAIIKPKKHTTIEVSNESND